MPHSSVASVKQADRADHHALGAEARHQPAGHRRHDGGGEDVERHHPGDLVLGRRHRALHLRQDGRRRQQRRAVERGAEHDSRQRQIALRRGHGPGGFVGVDLAELKVDVPLRHRAAGL